MTDLWLRQPKAYIIQALDEGHTKFTYHVAALLQSKLEILSWLRAAAMGYGTDVRVMLIDHAGAPEYSIFNNYSTPEAVYPTWEPEEKLEDLIWLIENPVGQNKDFCYDTSIQKDLRPVFGQKHRIVIHRVNDSGPTLDHILRMLAELQQRYPDVELFISGPKHFHNLFGLGFKAVDWMPTNMSETGAVYERVILPSGKAIKDDAVYDIRYKDWFELLGYTQSDLTSREDLVRYTLRSVAWAAHNFDLTKPFLYRARKKSILDPAFTYVSEDDFVLPAARRKLMRNVGLPHTEFDKFMCDTCILHNACTLYRSGSVCVVKGSETVGLADSFGTRNADAIIGGLGQLLKKQAERLEDAQAREDDSGELDPEVTKLYNSVFANGVKLAKLIDPSLSSAKVQVNVGVGISGQAAAVAASDPKQLVAGIVAALEAQGIPREQITSDMVKGVLTSMAQNGQQRAIVAAQVTNEETTMKQKIANATRVIEGTHE